jgi:predicted TIM-barrel fold metal-dependent hydrolase
MNRREFLSSPLALAVRPKGVLIDTHIHLFDPERFAYHRNAVYRPPAQRLDEYSAFVRQAGIDHAVIVHPEPYQDDHSYLEYCFKNEPSPMFFKGTCLFDATLPDTPARIRQLMERNPGRIVALRVHENRARNAPPVGSGPIRERDMGAMAPVWRAAQKLGIAIQMHFVPHFAPQIRRLAESIPDLPVILDHLARAGEGTPAEYEAVLTLAKLPRTYMKFSGVNYSSKQDHPYRDVQPLVRRTFDAFGPDRMLWGGLGMNLSEFEKRVAMFGEMFAFTTEENRAKIRGLNAARLFGWRA